MLCCADGTYYTGIALHTAKRISAHNAGQGAKYTRGRRPVRLVYQETGYSRGGALRRENELKNLSRAEKIKLASIFS
ncbi:MAG: GIY-YIG nuclease family protein [Candidatus Margulisbacteria bacterium]|jgi:putative endonuclease|nr:GIY-YIG nuclease family protein [Candidatus Margulisiibacteriota bacterium]